MKQKIWSMTLCLFIMAGLLFALPQSASAETEGIYEYSVSDGKATIIKCDKTTSGALIIPDTLSGYPVTAIGAYAFGWCDSLTSVTIGNSVTTIGDDAFSGCDSLTNIEVDAQNNYYSSLNGNLYNKDKTTLVWYACGKTDTFFAIPDSVTTIGEGAFYSCSSLTTITIPDSVTTIGERAFSGCDSLTNIEVDAQNNYYSSLNGNLYNKDKTTLIQYAIGKTDTSFAIPDSVTTIGEGAFSDCYSLTSVTIGNSVTTIGDLAFSYCESLTAVTIGNSVTTIGDLAFIWCYSLTSVTIGNSVTTIGDLAFSGCYSLTTITIPDGVTTIGYSAFSYCTGLTTITIPDGVTAIGDDAFYRCESLTDVYYTGTEYQWNAIEIASSNDHLLRATIHFNASGTSNASDTQPPQIRVMLNNQEISFDVPPQIVDGRTVVPLRAIFEALGATVIWDASTRTILAEKDGTVVQLTVDEKTMYVNGKAVELDVAAMIVDGRTLVPVRAISESFDCSVAWDGNTRTVSVTK